MFHVDKGRDRQTERHMTRLIVTVCNFVNVPKDAKLQKAANKVPMKITLIRMYVI